MSNYEIQENRELGATRSFSISRRMRRSITRVSKGFQNMIKAKDYEADEKSPRVIPECLDALSKRTGFSKEEIRRMYRAFKQYCPGGAATINDLKLVYAKIFPLGDSTKYAQIVFSKFDKDKDGLISFGDLIAGLTCIVKGTTEQKLSWIFGLYDIDGDGFVTRPEMLSIVSSIYDMIQSTQSIRRQVTNHVDRIFAKMDLNQDGVISKEEFLASCKNVYKIFVVSLLYTS